MVYPRLETILTTLKGVTRDVSETLPVRAVRDYLARSLPTEWHWPSFRIAGRDVRTPVVQGGMGVGISLSGLASAVAEAGGIGVIAANGIGLLEPDYYKDGRAANLRAFRREIRAARAKTDGLIGVNIMVAVNDFHELLDVAIDEEVDFVFMGAGLPIKDLPVERMRAAGVGAVPIVSSVRAVQIIFRMWNKIYHDVPDAVVFEGPKAGGHLGFSAEQIDDPDYQVEALVPDIVEALKPYEAEFRRSIPVIASGGVFTGEDIHATLNLGASAVQMGTRFVATDECDAHEAFKRAYVDATEEEIGLIASPVGMPGRAIRNEFIHAAEEGRRPAFRCAWRCLSSCKADEARYCISVALDNARRGNLKQGFVFAGSNAFRVSEIVPVTALMGELAEGFFAASRGYAVRRVDALIESIRRQAREYRRWSASDPMGARAVGEQIAGAVRESWAILLSHAGIA